MRSRISRWLVAALALALALPAWPRPSVGFREVRASYHAGTEEDLRRVIDGLEVSSKGWSVEPRFHEGQTAVFVTDKPMEADLLNLTMFFMSGRPNAAFAYFSLSYTTDENPEFGGNWEPLPMLNFGSTTTNLRRGPGNRLIADEVSFIKTGKIPDTAYWIAARTRGKAVTGFRIDVYPVVRAAEAGRASVMSWSLEKDFVLTEFRVDVVSTTTNVALGAPVTATHPLYFEFERMTADALTDGWPSTIAHPGADMTGMNFHFDIDLGRERVIDHLALRQRGDPCNLDRFGKLRVMLYALEPKSGAFPVWQVFHRPDGSYPGPGEADILKEADGQGEFRGRYLRISSENPVPLSPMLAEVEVYETRTARLMEVKADELSLDAGSSVLVPPGVQRLLFQFEIPQFGRPYDRLFRWRVSGVDNTWRISDSLTLEIPCPPAGDHQMEIQAAHSDGTWDASVLKVPFTVDIRFTRKPVFFWMVGMAILVAGALVSRYSARRKIARLEAQTAIAAERSRIARNMHDDVGARLARLAVLQDVFAREHALPAAAQEDLAVLTQSAREAMESLDEAVWAVNPRNDTLAALAAFLVQHAGRYLAPLGIACRFDGPGVWPEIPLRAGARHEVACAFKEALQNVVKHAAASEVELELRHQDGEFTIKVADNGRGFPDAGDRAGRNGLPNMRQRLESIGGSCAWLPRAGGGTIVLMKFPLP